MTIWQRLRGVLTTDPHLCALCATGITYDGPGTIAELMCDTWRGATVGDHVFRDQMTRLSVSADQAGVSWVWRFQDGSSLTANTDGVFVL